MLQEIEAHAFIDNIKVMTDGSVNLSKTAGSLIKGLKRNRPHRPKKLKIVLMTIMRHSLGQIIVKL
ncbi:MAG: hypothetical protein ACRYGR_02735 [Janthinobacterium lividum]